MSTTSLKSEIEQIINDSTTDITSDQIFSILQSQPDPGRTQEAIRSAIRELVNDHTSLIGSSSTGFFRIKTRDDLQRALNYIERRIPELQARAQNLRDSWNANYPDDQI